MAKENTIKQGLSDNEVNHIDLCITSLMTLQHSSKKRSSNYPI
jgi:hypothetical protein